MAEYEKKVRRVLAENGCYFIRHGKGDHDIWYNPAANKSTSVPTKIKSRHTANVVLKEIGLNKAF